MLLDNLSDLFQRGLEYAWDCEHLLIKQMPRMVEAATSQDLKQVLDHHLVETKAHIHRLEQVFSRLERSPAAEKSESTSNDRRLRPSLPAFAGYREIWPLRSPSTGSSA